MSFGVAALINVDPATMLTVALLYPSGPRVVNANSCRYVPVTVQIQGEARRAIAIEVIHDPANPIPLSSYAFNAALAERIVLPASSLQRVQPYVVPSM